MICNAVLRPRGLQTKSIGGNDESVGLRCCLSLSKRGDSPTRGGGTGSAGASSAAAAAEVAAGGAAGAAPAAALAASGASPAASATPSPRSACQRRSTLKPDPKVTPVGTEDELAAIADAAVLEAKAKLAAGKAGTRGQGSPQCL